MDEKYKSDATEITAERTPLPMDAYLMQHIIRQKGLNCLADSYVRSLIIALHSMYADGSPYAALMCRMLRIIDPRPIPGRLAVYLTRIRHEITLLQLATKRTTGKRRSSSTHGVT